MSLNHIAPHFSPKWTFKIKKSRFATYGYHTAFLFALLNSLQLPPSWSFLLFLIPALWRQTINNINEGELNIDANGICVWNNKQLKLSQTTELFPFVLVLNWQENEAPLIIWFDAFTPSERKQLYRLLIWEYSTHFKTKNLHYFWRSFLKFITRLIYLKK